MAEMLVTSGCEVWTIEADDGATRASFVPELGGIGSSIIMPDRGATRELLYQHNFFWDKATDETRGGWPFLFPICGRLSRDGVGDAYQVDGTTHALPIHGFGMRLPWHVADAGRPDTLVLEIGDTDETLAAYPFPFHLSLAYTVEPGLLRCGVTLTNTGAKDMPYYAGFHPYFLTPGPGRGKGDVTVSFQATRRHFYNEAFTGLAASESPPPIPMRIDDPGMEDMLIELRENREAVLSYPDGFLLHMEVTGKERADLFPYLQFYSLPDEPFVCVEPWMDYPNGLNRPDTVPVLAAGEIAHAELRLWSIDQARE